jgi:deazaflavin-dependent oxidoreductase (nitroreductase family)
VIVQVKGDRFPARARTADDAERAELWPLMVEVWPDYDAYQAKTDRQIPIVVLERVEG